MSDWCTDRIDELVELGMKHSDQAIEFFWEKKPKNKNLKIAYVPGDEDNAMRVGTLETSIEEVVRNATALLYASASMFGDIFDFDSNHVGDFLVSTVMGFILTRYYPIEKEEHSIE